MNKNGQWSTTNTLAGGHTIMNSNSGLCFAIEGASSGNGACLIQRACDYAASASDHLTPQGGEPAPGGAGSPLRPKWLAS